MYLGESGGLSVCRNFKPAPRGRELFGGETGKTGTEEQGARLAWRKKGAARRVQRPGEAKRPGEGTVACGSGQREPN